MYFVVHSLDLVVAQKWRLESEDLCLNPGLVSY